MSMQNYHEQIHEIAEKAFNGEYGEKPFEIGSEAFSAMYSDAWEKIGVNVDAVKDVQSGDIIMGDDVSIIDQIYDDFTSLNNQEIESQNSDLISAFDMENQERQAILDQSANMRSTDDVILNSDNPANELANLEMRNEKIVEVGGTPVTLQQSTLDALAQKGIEIDCSKNYVTQEGSSGAVENGSVTEREGDANYVQRMIDEGPAVDNPVADAKEPVAAPISQEKEPSPDARQNIDNAPTTNTSVEAYQPQEERVTRDIETVDQKENTDLVKEIIFRDESGDIESKVFAEADADGKLLDFVMQDADGNETRFTDIAGTLIKEDPEFVNVLSTAIEMAENGENWKDYLSNEIAGRCTVENKTDSEQKDQSTADNQSNQDRDGNVEGSNKHESKFLEHDSILKDRKENTVIPYRRDSINAYHKMAKTYNSFVGRIEMGPNGQKANIIDLFLSVDNFLKSDPIGTLIIELGRAIIDTFLNKDIEVTKGDVANDTPSDKLGIKENGDVEKILSEKDFSAVDKVRGESPCAGTSFGADMTKIDSSRKIGSDVNSGIDIRSTNPKNVEGRGFTVAMPDTAKYTFPDIRLVDFKGDRMLVDPFGKVLGTASDNSKISVGQHLPSLDLSTTPKGKVALETYANDNHISKDQAKDKISSELTERFCSRIEATYKPEAKGIESYAIPREQAVRADIDTKLANLDRMEKLGIKAEGSPDIGKVKEELLAARDKVDARITNLEARSTKLDHLADKVANSGQKVSLSDRFKDAVTSEKNAVGRSVFSVDLGIDKKSIDSTVSKGVETIKEKVAATNADKPEMDRVSYDSKTGCLVDRYGINDKGEYVGNTNGKFMAEGVTGPEHTKESVEAYLKEHYDPEKFVGVEKELNNLIENPENKDLAQPENKDIETPENKGVEATANDDIAKIENDEPDKTEGRDIEKLDGGDITKPEGSDITKPEGNDVTKPEGNDVTKPEGNDVTKPEGGDVTKPESGDVTKPEGNDTDKPEGNDIMNPENKDTETAENKDVANPDETPVEQPETPMEQPESPIEQPEVPVEQPETPIEQPETPVEQQPTEVPAENPGAEVEQPEDKPDETEKPEEQTEKIEEDSPDKDEGDSVDVSEGDSTDKDEEDPEEDIDSESLTESDDVEESDTDPADRDSPDGNESESGKVVDDVAAQAEDEIDADDLEEPEPVTQEDTSASTDKDKDAGTHTQSDTKDAAMADITGGEPDSNEKKQDKSDSDEDKKDALDEWVDSLFDGFQDLIDALGSGDTDKLTDIFLGGFEAKLDNLADIIDAIGNADSFGEAVSNLADLFVGNIEAAIDAKIECIENIIDIGSAIMDRLVEHLDMSSAKDLVEQVSCASEDYGDAMDKISDSGYEKFNEVYSNEYYELDNMNVSNEGVTDSVTGQEMSSFETPEAVDEFVTDVSNDAQQELNQIAQEAGDGDSVEVTNDPIEATLDTEPITGAELTTDAAEFAELASATEGASAAAEAGDAVETVVEIIEVVL